MALNDDDKKFIKKTVDDAVDKKTTSFEKSAANEKSSRLKAQIEERKERQAYLKQLKELQTNGDATMAQKFELMKEEINSKISQDIKDTVKTTMDTVGKGANTVGRGVGKATSGVDSLITRMASINPILAALYSGTKGVTRDIWNIGAGSVQAALGGAQMAWGAGKAAVGLVGSTMNSMRNMYLKRKAKNQPQQESEMEMETPLPATPQEEQQEQPNLELPSLLPEQESTSESLKDMQKRIKEIHEATVKSKKEQEDGMKSQLKSLAGMQKTMTAVNDVMKILKAKQMLIVGGVVLGAAALIGLVMWFKSGGFSRMIEGIGNKILNGLASEGGQEARKKADEYLQEQYNQIDVDAADFDKLQKDMNLSNGKDFSKTTYLTDANNKYNINQLRALDLQKSLQGEGFSEDRARNLVNGAWWGVQSAKYKNVGNAKPWVLKLPFKTYIPGNGIHKIKGDDVHVDFDLARKVDGKTIIVSFTNAIASSVKSKEFAPKEQIAVLDINSRIIGDWDTFCNIKEGQTTAEALREDRAEDIAKGYNKIMDEAYHTAGLDSVAREADKRLGVFREATADSIKSGTFNPNDTKFKFTEPTGEDEQQTPGPLTNPNEFDGAKTPDAGTVTGGAAPIPETTSENEQKVQQTSEQLTEATQPKPTEEKGYVGILPELGKTNITMETPSIFTPDKYSTQMTPFDYGLSARSQGQNTIGVGN